MAQDEQLIEAQHPSQSGGGAKALGVLAAVSAGGLMAMKMKSAPFMFLAGAAAVALLGRKRVIPASRPLELLPERPPAPPPPPRVEVDAWLSRQIEREQQAPVITLDVESLPETAPPAPEPLETAKAALEPPPAPPAEPVTAETPPPPPSLWDAPLATPQPVEETAAPPAILPRLDEADGAGFLFPAPLVDPAPSLYPEPPAGRSNAAWLLGIEPLPSWDELASSPAHAPPSSSDLAFLAEPPGAASYSPQPPPAPPPAPAPAPVQPLYVPSLFQGGALPDEITVSEESPPPPAAPDLAPAPALSEAFQAFEAIPFPAPMPAAEEPPPAAAPANAAPPEAPAPHPLPELVPVSLASPGEATFDDPLAALEENPSSLPGGLPPPPPLRPLAPVIEAEIVVRPRGLAPVSSIQPKSIKETAPPPVIPAAPPVQESAAPASPFTPDLPPAPVVLPREQKARKTWRSWWRGD